MPYSYSQPSSSDSSGTKRRYYAEMCEAYDAELALRAKGIPKNCVCGAEAEIVTCFGPSHPGRRFFSCPNHDDGNEHLRKWIDEAMLEELAKHNDELKDVKEEVSSVRNDVADISFKLHFLTIGDAKGAMGDIKKAQEEISEIKDMMVKLDDEIGELKKASVKLNVVLASIIVILGVFLMWYKW